MKGGIHSPSILSTSNTNPTTLKKLWLLLRQFNVHVLGLGVALMSAEVLFYRTGLGTRGRSDGMRGNHRGAEKGLRSSGAVDCPFVPSSADPTESVARDVTRKVTYVSLHEFLGYDRFLWTGSSFTVSSRFSTQGGIESCLMELMHVRLGVDEIVRLVVGELVASGGKKSAVSLASSCKNLKDPVLDALWETQDQLPPLLRSFPESVWENIDDFVSAIVAFCPFSLTRF